MAEDDGARTRLIDGPFLARLPLYAPEVQERTPPQEDLVETVRQADGLIVATPAYHAGISGLLKNGIDLLEDLRDDARPYLSDRAVGCIVTAYGWQGGGTTLISVRTDHPRAARLADAARRDAQHGGARLRRGG